MDISKNIKAIREERKISQSEIARRLGIEPTNYPRMEKRGDKLTVEQLGRIAGALGVSVVELLTGEPQAVQDSERVKELESRVNDVNYHISVCLNDIIRERAEKSRIGKVLIIEISNDVENCLWIELKDIPKEADIDNWLSQNYPYYQITGTFEISEIEEKLLIQRILRTNEEFGRLLYTIDKSIGLIDKTWSEEQKKYFMREYKKYQSEEGIQ